MNQAPDPQGSPPPPPPLATQLGRAVTQTIRTVQVNVGSSLQLRPGVKTPEIHLVAQGSPPTMPPGEQVEKLVRDHYLLGRSTQCDLVVNNPLVSGSHCSLHRHPQDRRRFILKDENSRNGIYLGTKRIKTLVLRDGDLIRLGPPELLHIAEFRYVNPGPLWLRLLRFGLMGLLGAGSLATAILLVAWCWIPVRPLPQGVSGPVVIYARDGETVLNPVRNEAHRELPALKSFSTYLPMAAIASEDARFYWHFGVDPKGLLRAVVVTLRGGQQGGSTLTQQVARSLFPQVGRQNTLQRKVKEMLVALKLEMVYSKQEILKTYLNRVYLGEESFGFEDAAQFYFEKSAADLTLAEAATLVAMLPAPNRYNPVTDYNTSQKLRNIIIEKMHKQGMISQDEANEARRSRVKVSDRAKTILSQRQAPYFYSYIFQELGDLLGEDLAREGNFIVETSLDLATQRRAERSLREGIANDGKRYGFSQGALVTLNSQTGEILALVGGKDYNESQFNRALALRQPGSTFKVFTYAAALEQGISPDTTYPCDPLTWKGQKFRGCERSSGMINMYRALAQSENVIALRLAQQVGLDEVIAMARRLGIMTPLRATPGLVLGESEVPVLQMTGAYSVFANGGVWNRPHGIRRIWDSGTCTDPRDRQTCKLIYDYRADEKIDQRAISPEVAGTMRQLMRGTVNGGTGRAAAIGRGEAGKTGTTNDNRDLWFVGFIPNAQLVTGIWLGNDDNTPTRGSSAQAARLWGSYMGGL